MQGNQTFTIPQQYETVSKFDKARGQLEGVALFTKPTTVKTVVDVVGKAETFVIESARTEHGDYVFLEHVDEGGLTRIYLPPAVTRTIARHSEQLSKRNRSRRAKATMKARIAAGENPTAHLLAFQKKRRGTIGAEEKARA